MISSVKIAVLLSGGVDSSTALLLLKKQIPDAKITAYYLKIWLEDELASLGSCPWEEDLHYAENVCRMADVPLHVLSLQKEYWDEVVSYTVSELKAGRTPSPDLLCNKNIKFGVFLDRLGELPDKAASGHYAVEGKSDSGSALILRAPDPVKDQTYFLGRLSQEQAALACFPIGHLLKSEVRTLAQEWKLPNRERKDSQGICFLGKIRYTDFVRHYLGEKEGLIVEAGTEKILGKHKGTWFFTTGQRTGLGLSGGPWYVTARNMEENVLMVAGTQDAEESARKTFTAANPNWISDPPSLPARLSMKLRHGPRIVEGMTESLPSAPDGTERLQVTMAESDRGLAAGQFAVFYDGEVCLGAAMIDMG